MKRIVLNIFLFLLFISVIEGRVVVPNDASKEPYVLPYILELCQDSCDNLLKDDFICQNICAFHTHLSEQHSEDILSLWRRTGYQTEPLIWAMNDLVKEIFTQKLDDSHSISEKYMITVQKWYQRTKVKQDL